MLFQNLRSALRLFRRSPGVSLVAVLTLALGIGANTAVFSVVNAVMLRPLPYTEPERLASVWEGRTNHQVNVDNVHGPATAVSAANFVDYQQQTRAFEGLAGYASTSLTLTRSGPPEQLRGEAVTWNYFDTLGVQPFMGRAFRPEEDRPGAAHVVVLTHRLWRSRFAADPAIVGRAITLNGEAHTVVGITDPTFQPLTQFGSATPVVFFVPAAYPDALLANHGDHGIAVVGRLRRGVTIAQAQQDLDAIAGDLARRFPDGAANLRTLTGPLARDLVRDARTPLLMLAGAVALVLLVACVNVANLLIVRAIDQRREIAVRLAIGASRQQIVAEMLTRGVVLGGVGGALGLLCGVWTRDALVALAPSTLPRVDALALDANVLTATLIVSTVTGVLAGLLPAWHASRTEAGPALKATALHASTTGAILRWRGVLMAGEIAAALVLAVGAGLLIKSLVALRAVDLGFETDRVLAANITLPPTRYPDASQRLAFFEELARRVRTLPGVKSVAFANRLPMRGGWGGGFTLEGGGQQPDADFQAVSSGYFATLGIPLVRGRLLNDDDRLATGRVAVVSRAFARKFLGDRDPIGVRFSRAGTPPIVIVGVVADVRRGGKAAPLEPQVYFPAAQLDLYSVVRLGDFAVRAAGDPGPLVNAVQREVWAIDPDQPLTNVKTLDEVLSASMAERRFELLLLASFAVLAVGLAVVGVYGVVAYAASGRAREIGIRVALGATRGEVIALVVKGGAGWTLAGIAAGLLGAWAAARVMGTLLFQVTPGDPATFAAIAAAMLLVALTASYLPARKAASVDPIAVLRAE